MSTNHQTDLQGSEAHQATGVQLAQASTTATDATADRVITVTPGAQIDLSDISLDGATLTLAGQGLMLTLADGTKILLQDFVTASLSDNPPSFVFGGDLQMSAADMLANAAPAAGGELPPGVNPQAGTAGTQDDDGSTVAPEAQGPIGPAGPPTGPLGPTSLAFSAPEPQLDTIFLPGTAVVVEEEVEGECPEITCQDLFNAFFATWAGPVDGRVSADDAPAGDPVPGQGNDIYEGTKAADLMVGNSDEFAQAILGLGDDDWIQASDDTAVNAVHGDTPFFYSFGEGIPDLPIASAEIASVGYGEGGVPGDDVIFGGDSAGQFEVLVGGGGNDYIDGRDGHELIVGDEVAVSASEISHYNGGPSNGYTYYDSYAQLGVGTLTASDVYDERADNYNDALFSGDGHAIMVGDLAVSGIREETNYNWQVVGYGEGSYGEGSYGEGSYGEGTYGEGGEYTPGEYTPGAYIPGPFTPGDPIYDYVAVSTAFNIGFAEGVFLGAGAFDGGTVNAFNDFIDAELSLGYGEGEPTLAGLGGFGEGFGSALIGDVAALGHVGLDAYYEDGIQLTAALGQRFGLKPAIAAYGEGYLNPDGGTVTAFNDSLCGTDAADLLVGDVLQIGFGEGGAWIGLSAEGYATNGGQVHAYNDTLLGQGGDDLSVGDVFAEGLGKFSRVVLSVMNQAEGYGYVTRDADGNTYDAFNDAFRPGAGNDLSVGDVYMIGYKDRVSLWAGNKASGTPYGFYGEGGASADGNTFYAYNDEICDDGPFGVAIGDVFAEGGDNTVNLAAYNYASGSYGEGNSASDNTFTVFSDELHAGDSVYGEGGYFLVGDVLMQDRGQSYHGANANLGVFNEAQGINSYSDYMTVGGGEANNNTFNAFQDHIVGSDGRDSLVGDLAIQAYYSVAEGSMAVSNHADFGYYYGQYGDGGQANNNTFNAFNDVIEGHGGFDYAVGDAAITGYIDGYETDWPYFQNRPGFQMYVDNVAAGNYGEGGQANGNTFNAFNDSIDIGDGGGLAVGDLYFQGWGEGDIDLDVVNVAEGFGGYFAEGGARPDGGEASNNTFNAFNDTIIGGLSEGYYYPEQTSAVSLAGFGYGSEVLVGDVLYQNYEYCGDAPRLELQVHNMAEPGPTYAIYGEGGIADNNVFNAYNDTIIGGPETGPAEGYYYLSYDVVVGDVLAEGAGDINLWVNNEANEGFDYSYFSFSSASGNEFNTFNDDMTLGFGEGVLVGDVFAEGNGCCGEGDGLDIRLEVSNQAGYAGTATDNVFNSFNDTIVGHDYGDEIVGDVYVFGGKLDHLEMALYNQTGEYYDGNSQYYGNVQGTVINAFNDTIDGGDAGEYYYNGNYLTGDVYFSGYAGCETDMVFEAFGSYGTVGEGDGLFSDQFTAWSDTIDGGDGYDQIIGDLEVGSYGGYVDIGIDVGSENGNYYGADGEYSLFNDTMAGFGEGDDMYGDMLLWGEGEVNIDVTGRGDFHMFNDHMDGGGDNDFMVGDVYFGKAKGDWFNDFHVDVNGPSEAGGSYHMFNDTLLGGDGNDGLFGDFFYEGGSDSNGYVNYSNLSVHISGLSEGDDVTLFHDVLVGGAGDDDLYGQLGSDDLTGGAGADVFWFGEGDGSQPSEHDSNFGSDISDLDPFVQNDVIAGALHPGDVIRDFEDGVDRIGLYGDLDFEDLNIFNNTNGDAVIQVSGTSEILATVLGIDAGQLTEADFIIV